MDEPTVFRRPSVRTLGRLLAAAVPVAVGSVWVARSGIGIADVRALIAHHPAAPVLFLLIHTVASLLFLPRTMLAVVAGMVFGAGWGVVWAALGSVLGAVAGFWVARCVAGGATASDAMTRFGDILRRVERGGWRAVAMLRLVPLIPHSAANYGLGLTRLPLGSYALGSLLGQLPMTIAFVEFGAAGNGVLSGQPGWLLPTVVGGGVLAVSTLLPRVVLSRA